MPQCLKCINPLSQKPGLGYVLFLLKLSNAPYALVEIVDEGKSVAFDITTCGCGGSIDTSAFEGTANEYLGFFKEIEECIARAVLGGVKPNCGIPEIDNAVREAQANPRSKEALEKVKCLHLNAYVNRVVDTASGHYAVIRSLNPCGLGRLILLPGSGVYDAPQSKLEAARLLGRLLPDYIQVDEAWNDYTHLAYLVAKAPSELLPHIAVLATSALGVNDYPSDRAKAYITTEALLSTVLGIMAIIDIEGDAPFVVKFPKAPFNEP